MTPKDDLFRLIAVLTPRERQTFSKAAGAGREKEPKYLLLFQALCDLTHYDEAAFLASKRGSPFQKNFAVQKKELYEKVLQVLRAQRHSAGAEKPIEFQVREFIEDARLLWEKKLFDLGQARLRHARAEAERYQFHEVLLEILRQERAMRLAEQAQGYEDAIFALHQEIEEISRIIHNKFRLLFLRDQLFLPTSNHASLAHKLDMETIHRVMQEPELSDVSKCLSFEATTNHHFCHAIFHHLRDDPQQAWIHFRAIYLMWQQRKEVQRTKAVEYRNMVQNYLSLSNDALRYEDFEIAMGQLLKGPFKSEAEEITAQENSLNVRLQKHLNLCEWREALQVFHDYKQLQGEIGDHMNPSRMMTFYLSFSRLFLVMERWNDCRKWAKMVLDEGGNHLGEGLVIQAQMQEMIALFELGETEQMVKAKKRILKWIGQSKAAQFEIELVKWMCKFVGQIDTVAQGKAFKAMLLKLEQNTQRKATANRILRAWLRAKTESKSLNEVLVEERDETLKALRNSN